MDVPINVIRRWVIYRITSNIDLILVLIDPNIVDTHMGRER